MKNIDMLMAAGRVLCLGILVFCLLHVAIGFPGLLGEIARILLILIVVLHPIETAVFYRSMRASGESLWPQVLSSLVYGIFYNYRYLGNRNKPA